MEQYYSPLLQRGVKSRQVPLDSTPYNDSESSHSPVRFAQLQSDDRGERYNEYLEAQRQPKKDLS